MLSVRDFSSAPRRCVCRFGSALREAVKLDSVRCRAVIVPISISVVEVNRKVPGKKRYCSCSMQHVLPHVKSALRFDPHR